MRGLDQGVGETWVLESRPGFNRPKVDSKDTFRLSLYELRPPPGPQGPTLRALVPFSSSLLLASKLIIKECPLWRREKGGERRVSPKGRPDGP